MAKDFSNPKKLGFLRFIQVMFALNVIFTVVFSTLLITSSYQLTFGDILDYLNIIFDAMGFWLIWQRKRATRAFVFAFCIFNIVIGTGYNLGTGDFSLPGQIMSSIFDIILLLYFGTSRRVKAVLTEPLSLTEQERNNTINSNYYKPRTWAFWRNIIIYFCVFSVVGHWMEAAYCTLIKYGILPGIYDPNSQIWSDWLYPFVVYGVGAAACVLLFYPVKNFLLRKCKGVLVPLVLSFIVNALVCTLIELVMGLMLNQPLPDGTMPLWDYRDMFCNFMGQICLQNAIAFGLVATLMTWIIYPVLELGISRLSREAANILFVAVVVGFAILMALYCINIVIPNLTIATDVSGESYIEIGTGQDGDTPALSAGTGSGGKAA